MKLDHVHAEFERGEVDAIETVSAPKVLDQLLSNSRHGAAEHEPLIGHLEGIDGDGRLLFRLDGSTDQPVPIAIGIELPDGQLVRAAREGRRALVVRTGGLNPRLVLTGLLRERVSMSARDAGAGQLEVLVDGETIRLEAKEKILLRCGKASLELRQDGRVVISGVYVIAKSRGPVKLKGATIALN